MELFNIKDFVEHYEFFLKEGIKDFEEKYNRRPTLAIVSVDPDAASQVYLKNKVKACERVGMDHIMYILSKEDTEEDILNCIEVLNNNKYVDGIIVQLPLPEGLDSVRIQNSVDPMKDVDSFSAVNVGNLVLENNNMHYMPATVRGIYALLTCATHVNFTGLNAVVVGRSDIVGKPMAQVLLGMDMTVSICHSKTKDLSYYTKNADVLVVAAGVPNLIKGDMIKPGAIVIDVGINRVDGKLCGDVDIESCKEVDCKITPVPGGVGKLTVLGLLIHTYTRAGAKEAMNNA